MGNPTPEEFLPLKHREFLMLLGLLQGPNHGYALKQAIERRTRGRLRIGPGTLYRTVRALEDAALIAECDSHEEPKARKRTYAITDLGREVLRAESRRLESLVREAQARKIPS